MEEDGIKKVVFFTKIDRKAALKLKENAEEYQKLSCKSSDSILEESLNRVISKIDNASSSYYYFMIFCHTVDQLYYHIVGFNVWLEHPTFYMGLKRKPDGVIIDTRNQEYYDLKDGLLIEFLVRDGKSAKFLLEQVSEGILPKFFKDKPNDKENENRLQEQESSGREGNTERILYGKGNLPKCSVGHLRDRERTCLEAGRVRKPQAVVSTRHKEILRA